jgi:hypothetical protein
MSTEDVVSYNSSVELHVDDASVFSGAVQRFQWAFIVTLDLIIHDWTGHADF